MAAMITAQLDTLLEAQKTGQDVIAIRARIQNCIWTMEETLALLHPETVDKASAEIGQAFTSVADILSNALREIGESPEIVELKDWKEK